MGMYKDNKISKNQSLITQAMETKLNVNWIIHVWK